MSGFRFGVISSAKKQASGVVAVVQVSADTEVEVPVARGPVFIPLDKLAGQPCVVFDIGIGDAGIGCMPTGWMSGDEQTDRIALVSDVQGVMDAIANGVPVATDGGAALQTSIVLGFAGLPVGSALAEVE